MIVASVAQDSGILQINKVTRCFGLGEVEDFFEVGNAHFAIHKNQVQNPQARFIGTSLENLRSQRKIKTFQAHSTSYPQPPKV